MSYQDIVQEMAEKIVRDVEDDADADNWTKNGVALVVYHSMDDVLEEILEGTPTDTLEHDIFVVACELLLPG